MILLFFIIFIFIVLILFIRYYTIYNLLYFNKVKKNLKDVNLLNDNYFTNSKNKSNNKLYKNLAVIRENLYDNEFDFDIKLLDLQNNYKILILNTLNIDFELSIINKFNKENKKIYIFSTSNNLLNIYYQKKKKKYYNLFFIYSDIQDVYKKFNIKFDRIILRENLGNISNRYLFLKNIKTLLKNSDSFIFVKTFTFNNIIESNYIFEKQKKLIDYWNYNFSSSQSIFNDIILLNYKAFYSKINLPNLLLLSNHKDIINYLKLFFIEMNMNFNDLKTWFVIYSIELLFIKIYNY